jgi:hypothetical protein
MRIKLQTTAVIASLEATLATLVAKNEALTKQEEVNAKISDKFKKGISKNIVGFDLSKIEYYNGACCLYFKKSMTREEYESLIGEQPDELKYELKRSKREIEDIQKSIRLLRMCADETVPTSLLQDITCYL